jgi:septum formation protein
VAVNPGTEPVDAISPPRLILASTSRYRRELLTRLQLAFDAMAPGVDEAPRPLETPLGLAVRLAHAKAEAVARAHPGSVVIGSDQVAELDRKALGKPHTHERAMAQLRNCSGREVLFHTAVCVIDTEGAAHPFLDRTVVRFRHLGDAEIERYLRAETPYDCAGSFKSEGLGASLFESIDNRDPTALIGLPLIELASVLRRCGFRLP